ncbi:hypothetical protein ACFFWC_12135 [Plantactinospora siamensis]|uniref:RAMA domain-containing protein n=1 Tax=Plantactinospora siamensis TaxID=555372 RepID=A0ABV6P1K1_9ACTN
MHRIEIDDEVYAVLEHNVKGFEQPNDVLRRLLLGGSDGQGGGAPHTSLSVPGALADLISDGPIMPGDTLSHVQVRKGRSFTATVEADGWIKTDKGRYRKPSPALAALVDTSIDGWLNWRHDRSRKTLRELRAESGRLGKGSLI